MAEPVQPDVSQVRVTVENHSAAAWALYGLYRVRTRHTRVVPHYTVDVWACGLLLLRALGAPARSDAPARGVLVPRATHPRAAYSPLSRSFFIIDFPDGCETMLMIV